MLHRQRQYQRAADVVHIWVRHQDRSQRHRQVLVASEALLRYRNGGRVVHRRHVHVRGARRAHGVYAERQELHGVRHGVEAADVAVPIRRAGVH